jgi:hypothetical protein
MFIVLGINDGGAQVTGGTDEIKFDFKTGSTGVLVFVVGALMATVGGVLKNDYSTVPIPTFYYNNAPSEYSKSIDAYNECKEKGKEIFQSCFIGIFEDINKGLLK